MTTPQQILDYMKTHSRKFGSEQSTKDLQSALNVLNRQHGNKSARIEIDGKYGVQTHAALESAAAQYSLKDIQTNIKRAAVSNVIFDTKNNKRINTEKQIERVYNNFGESSIVLEGSVSKDVHVKYVWQAEGCS